MINEYLQHGDLYAVAETHLSTKSGSSFRRGLRVTQYPFQYLVTGNPVPVRVRSQTAGGWRGVAALSKHPTRAVPVPWSDDLLGRFGPNPPSFSAPRGRGWPT